MEELQISRSKVNDVGIASLKGLLSFEGMAEFICVVVEKFIGIFLNRLYYL